MRCRGRDLGSGVVALAILHPAAILRQNESIAREYVNAAFVADLHRLLGEDRPPR